MLEDATAVDLDGDVARVIAAAGGTIGCGDGFVQPTGGTALAIPGRCTGLAALGDDQGVVVTDTGATVLLDLQGGMTSLVDMVEDVGQQHEDVTVHDGAIYVASGVDGLLRFDPMPNALGAAVPVPGATDARGVASSVAGLLVADGTAGVRLVDPEGGGSITALDLDPPDTPARAARRVVVDDARAYVLRGVHGLSVVDIAEASLSLFTSIVTEGIVLDAAPVEGGLLIATGSALVRASLPADPDQSPVLVSRQARPDYGDLAGGWVQTVTATPEGPVATVGPRMTPVSLGPGDPQPWVHVERATYSFWADPGESTESIVAFDNRGAAPMMVTDLAADPFSVVPLSLEERAGCPGQFIVPASDRGLVTMTYADPSADVLLGSFGVTTDTSDDPMFALRVEVNRSTPSVGQPAPLFEVPTSEGGLLRATDFSDRVVFVKVFNET
ncbi:MAG: hypothetical protein AAGF11_32595 [Myxococcota bacterium]